MNKNSTSNAGFFRSRLIIGLALCSVGLILGALVAAAPNQPQKPDPQKGADFKPTVSYSVYNAISPAVTDLPVVVPTVPTEWESEAPRRLHAPQPPPKLPVHDPVQQTSAGSLTMPAPNLTFEGMNQGGGCGNCIPPDTNGAVGPNHYVQMVNSSFAVYTRTGTLVAGPTHINNLFNTLPPGASCRVNNNGDPVVIYDRLADRWVLTQFAVPGGAAGYDECIAVSVTSNPAGAYYAYDFHLSNTVFHDYPKLGVWPDAYYMTTNEFPPNAVLSQGYGAFAFERDKMLIGQPARMVFFDLGPININFAGALPSDVDGAPPPPGSPNYFVEVDDEVFVPPFDAMRIWKFHVDWTNPANSTFGNAGQPNFVITVPDFTPPECLLSQGVCIQQLESPYQLDALGDRIMFRLAYRNFGDHEAIVVNHSVVADVRVGIRWYEVRDLATTPTIFQTGTFAPVDQLHRWMGSIAMDRMGNIAVGYSTSSAATHPSIAYAGRLVNDPPGQLAQGEAQMWAGPGSENVAFYVPPVGRWGDYSDLTVDPTDDCTFWYTTEYFGAEGTTNPGAPWRTRVGSFKFPSCVPEPTLLSVVSRKTHGTAGTFEINLPLTGTPGIECRSGGANGDHHVVFKFDAPVTFTGAATCGGNAATATSSGNEVTVNCTGVPNAQTISVALTGNINRSVPMSVLLGDTSASGAVNSSDISQTKAQSGMAANGVNFRTDVTVNGVINSSDIATVKSKSGTALP